MGWFSKKGDLAFNSTSLQSWSHCLSSSGISRSLTFYEDAEHVIIIKQPQF